VVRRHGPLAVFLAPTWVAGVSHMEWRRFVPWNLLAALAWTLVTGLGGYWIGPPMTRALGVANAAILVCAVVLIGGVIAFVWRRRRDARAERSDL
jgi:membrane-associated protein